jgi:hypothetical protein
MKSLLEEKDLRISPIVRGYILIISILYIVYGLLQFYNGIGYTWIPWLGNEINLGVNVLDTYIPNAFPDPFSGLTLIIVGLILARSIQLYHRADYVKATGFLFVGWTLGVILMILNILIILADILDAYYPLIWGESVEGWTLSSDPWGIAPHLIIGILLLPVYWHTTSIKQIIRGLIPE